MNSYTRYTAGNFHPNPVVHGRQWDQFWKHHRNTVRNARGQSFDQDSSLSWKLWMKNISSESRKLRRPMSSVRLLSSRNEKLAAAECDARRRTRPTSAPGRPRKETGSASKESSVYSILMWQDEQQRADKKQPPDTTVLKPLSPLNVDTAVLKPLSPLNVVKPEVVPPADSKKPDVNTLKDVRSHLIRALECVHQSKASSGGTEMSRIESRLLDLLEDESFCFLKGDQVP